MVIYLSIQVKQQGVSILITDFPEFFVVVNFGGTLAYKFGMGWFTKLFKYSMTTPYPIYLLIMPEGVLVISVSKSGMGLS